MGTKTKKFATLIEGIRAWNITSSSSKNNVAEIEETLKSEHFQLGKLVRHGFPYQPTCIAYDPVQQLLAIGDKQGSIRIFGQAGVDYHLKQPSGLPIIQLIFLVNQGALISLCQDDALYMWTIRQKKPDIVHTLKFKREHLTCGSLSFGSNWLYIGTEHGNIHFVNVIKFALSGYLINWNKAIDLSQSTHPGAVVQLEENPQDSNKLLIGFSTGLIVLWDLRSKTAEARFRSADALFSFSWHFEGKQFSTAHANGQLLTWNYRKPQKPETAVQPHSREVCDDVSTFEPIKKLQWKITKSGEAMMIFAGGSLHVSPHALPSLTVMRGKRRSVLQMEYPIIDLVCLTATPFASDPSEPFAVAVLCQKDLVVIDLQATKPGTQHRSYLSFQNPYPFDLHSSPVTCCHYISNCAPDLIPALYSVGASRGAASGEIYSQRDWPIKGGTEGVSYCSYSNILITGHADGSIRFWDASGMNLTALYKVTTARFYTNPPQPKVPTPATSTPVTSPSAPPPSSTSISGNTDASLSSTEGTAASSNNNNNSTSSPTKTSNPPSPTSKSSADTSVTDASSVKGVSTPDKKPVPTPSSQPTNQNNLNTARHPICPQHDQSMNGHVVNLQEEFPYAITSIYICSESRKMLVAGPTHSTLLFFNKTDILSDIPVLDINMMYDPTDDAENVEEASKSTSNTSTANHLPHQNSTSSQNTDKDLKVFIPVRSSSRRWCPGYQPELVCRLGTSNGRPPSPITTITLNSSYGLLAIGNDCGIAIIDYVQKICLLSTGTPDLYGSISRTVKPSKKDKTDESKSPFEQPSSDVSSPPPSTPKRPPPPRPPALATKTPPARPTSRPPPIKQRLVSSESWEIVDKDDLDRIDSSTTSLCSKKSDGEANGSKTTTPTHSTEQFPGIEPDDLDMKNLVDEATMALTMIEKSLKDNITYEESKATLSPTGTDEGLPKEQQQQPVSTDEDVIDASSSTSSTASTKCSNKRNSTKLIGRVKSFMSKKSDSQQSMVDVVFSPPETLVPEGNVDSKTLPSTRRSQPPNFTLIPPSVEGMSGASPRPSPSHGMQHHVEVIDLSGESPVRSKMPILASKFLALSPLLVILTLKQKAEKGDSNLIAKSCSSSTSSLDHISCEAIRSLAFADTFSKKGDPTPTPCLWIGTSLGSVLVVNILFPESRSTQPIIVSPSGTIFRLSGELNHISFLNCLGDIMAPPAEKWGDGQRPAYTVSHPVENTSAPTPETFLSPPQPTHVASSAPSTPTMPHHSFHQDHTTASGQHLDRQFAVLCSDKHARVVSLPSQSCLYKAQITETSAVVRSDVIRLRNGQAQSVLMVYLSNGRIVAHSLPSLRVLFDTDCVPLDDLVASSLTFGHSGHVMYMASPTEFDMMTFSADMCSNIDDMKGDLFVPCEMPEAPKKNFFQNLFSAGASQLDRDELFGEATSGKASIATAAQVPNSKMEKIQGQSSTAASEMARAKMAAIERGERLGQLDDKTTEMMEQAKMFGNTANLLAKKYEKKDKRWGLPF